MYWNEDDRMCKLQAWNEAHRERISLTLEMNGECNYKICYI